MGVTQVRPDGGVAVPQTKPTARAQVRVGKAIERVRQDATPPSSVTSSSGPGVAAYDPVYAGDYGYDYSGGGYVPADRTPARSTEEQRRLDALNEQAVASAIKAIEKQYGLTEQQLMADETERGRQYRLLKVQALRQRDANVEAIAENAAARGVFRSGFRAEAQADEFAVTAEYLADLQAKQQYESQATQLEIEMGKIQQAADIAQARADRQGRVLTVEEVEALSRAGLA